jgi:hypothetical protein
LFLHYIPLFIARNAAEIERNPIADPIFIGRAAPSRGD